MKITKKDYLTLCGIDSMKDKYNDILNGLLSMALDITKDKDEDMGHTSDWIFGGVELDRILKNLNIEVEE